MRPTALLSCSFWLSICMYVHTCARACKWKCDCLCLCFCLFFVIARHRGAAFAIFSAAAAACFCKCVCVTVYMSLCILFAFTYLDTTVSHWFLTHVFVSVCVWLYDFVLFAVGRHRKYTAAFLSILAAQLRALARVPVCVRVSVCVIVCLPVWLCSCICDPLSLPLCYIILYRHPLRLREFACVGAFVCVFLSLVTGTLLSWWLQPRVWVCVCVRVGACVCGKGPMIFRLSFCVISDEKQAW